VRELAIAVRPSAGAGALVAPARLVGASALDPVQTAFDAVCQKVSPDAPCAVGPVAGRKLALSCWPTVSSLRDLALGDRFSQAWKPDRDTPISSHSHATGQMFRCFELHVASLREVGSGLF
jgi:hypothetical protein